MTLVVVKVLKVAISSIGQKKKKKKKNRLRIVSEHTSGSAFAAQ